MNEKLLIEASQKTGVFWKIPNSAAFDLLQIKMLWRLEAIHHESNGVQHDVIASVSSEEIAAQLNHAADGKWRFPGKWGIFSKFYDDKSSSWTIVQRLQESAFVYDENYKNADVILVVVNYMQINQDIIIICIWGKFYARHLSIW